METFQDKVENIFKNFSKLNSFSEKLDVFLQCAEVREFVRKGSKRNWKNTTFRALRAHLLFQLCTFSLCIHCKTKTKKSNFVGGKFFLILIIYKPYLGTCEVPHTIWARSIQPFWRLFDTNKQTNRQAKYIYRNLKKPSSDNLVHHELDSRRR